MCTFKEILRWYNNKDVVPTPEPMRKMIVFHHNKGIDMLTLGCTLPNLAKTCLRLSTTAEFDPFTGSDQELLEKMREDMVGGPSIVLTRITVVDETFNQGSTNWSEAIVGIIDSQLRPFCMCQTIPAGLCTRWELDVESGKFKPRQNITRSYENIVMSYFQRVRPQCKVENFYTTSTQKKHA